jgi:DNA-binding NarL/FixJ family response regulator
MHEELQNNRIIFLTNAMGVQNRLMAKYVSEKTGARCDLESRLEEVAALSKQSSQRILVLYDCLFKTRGELLEMLQSEARKRLMNQHLVLFNLCSDCDLEMEALSKGITGLHYTHDPLDSFLRMMQVIFSGQLWVSRQLLSNICKEMTSRTGYSIADSAGLTAREIEVLKLMTEGKRNKEIAENLYVSLHTVKSHQHHIFKKLGISNRNQAALWASKNL